MAERYDPDTAALYLAVAVSKPGATARMVHDTCREALEKAYAAGRLQEQVNQEAAAKRHRADLMVPVQEEDE
jgi:hypothetical protein